MVAVCAGWLQGCVGAAGAPCQLRARARCGTSGAHCRALLMLSAEPPPVTQHNASALTGSVAQPIAQAMCHTPPNTPGVSTHPTASPRTTPRRARTCRSAAQISLRHASSTASSMTIVLDMAARADVMRLPSSLRTMVAVVVVVTHDDCRNGGCAAKKGLPLRRARPERLKRAAAQMVVRATPSSSSRPPAAAPCEARCAAPNDSGCCCRLRKLLQRRGGGLAVC